METIRIVADSTCDLSPKLVEQYGVEILPLNIVLHEKSYRDGVEITPDEIYDWADAHATTPKTAAPALPDVLACFRAHQQAGHTLLCFGISSQMSSCCQVMRLAAEELHYADVFVIDSRNLSTGIGLQVLRAAELAAQGVPAQDIAQQIEAARDRVRASFVVDTLTYLHRGGRCGTVTALLGNALKLKPRIEVTDGAMHVAKKYRGPQDKVVAAYVEDLTPLLLQAEPAHVFITHSGISDSVVQQVKARLQALEHFTQIHVTRAGGVVSSHCGYGTLGVLFYLASSGS